MGYQTKVQKIKREKSEQWYISVPAQIAASLDFERGEAVEWHIEDRGMLILKRANVPDSILKKTN